MGFTPNLNLSTPEEGSLEIKIPGFTLTVATPLTTVPGDTNRLANEPSFVFFIKPIKQC